MRGRRNLVGVGKGVVPHVGIGHEKKAWGEGGRRVPRRERGRDRFLHEEKEDLHGERDERCGCVEEKESDSWMGWREGCVGVMSSCIGYQGKERDKGGQAHVQHIASSHKIFIKILHMFSFYRFPNLHNLYMYYICICWCRDL